MFRIRHPRHRTGVHKHERPQRCRLRTFENATRNSIVFPPRTSMTRPERPACMASPIWVSKLEIAPTPQAVSDDCPLWGPPDTARPRVAAEPPVITKLDLARIRDPSSNQRRPLWHLLSGSGDPLAAPAAPAPASSSPTSSGTSTSTSTTTKAVLPKGDSMMISPMPSGSKTELQVHAESPRGQAPSPRRLPSSPRPLRASAAPASPRPASPRLLSQRRHGAVAASLRPPSKATVAETARQRSPRRLVLSRPISPRPISPRFNVVEDLHQQDLVRSESEQLFRAQVLAINRLLQVQHERQWTGFVRARAGDEAAAALEVQGFFNAPRPKVASRAGTTPTKRCRPAARPLSHLELNQISDRAARLDGERSEPSQ